MPKARHLPLLTLPLILTASLAILTTPTPATTLEAHLETNTPLQYDGETTLNAQGGLLTQWDPHHNMNIHLEAERLQLINRYEQGHTLGTEELRILTARGSDHQTFNQATLTLNAWNNDAILLAEPSTATLHAHTHGPTTQTPLPPSTHLAHGGVIDERYSNAEEPPPRYAYATHQPLIHHAHHQHATLQGNFTLFTYNTTLQLTTPHESHTDWTGIRQGERDDDYEVQLILLRTTNATLTLETPQRIQTLTTTQTTHHHGTLKTQQTQGHIDTPHTTHTLHEDPLHLEGQTHTETTLTQPPHAPTLNLHIEADHETLQTPTPPPQFQDQLAPSPLLLILITLVLIATIALHTQPTLLHHLPKRARERLQQHYQTKARQHEDTRRWRKAAHAYTRLTHLDPTHATAYHGKALAHLENNEPATALETIQTAKQRLGNDPDLLTFETYAAWENGDTKHAQQALHTLAQQHPQRATHLLIDLPHDPFTDDPKIQRLLAPSTGGGSIDGYA